MLARIGTLATIFFVAVGLAATATYAQSYYDLASGIIGEGQAYEAQFWNAYQRSLQAEQNLYAAAMHDPQVQAAYQTFLAQGGRASLQEFAVYYVRTAGGNPAAYRRYTQRVAQLNAQDRQAIFNTHEYINALQQRMMNERSQSFYRYTYHTGELLGGAAMYSDGNYNYQIPTTLTHGQLATDQFGNTFTVDHNNTFYRWTDWGWQALHYGAR